MCRYMKLWIFVILPVFLGIADGSKWSKTGNMNQVRKGYTGVLFTDGKFMIAGCHTWEDTHYDIFDPATGTWTLGDLLVGNHHSMTILLPSGEVLYASNQTISYCLYNQVTGWRVSSVVLGWSPYNCATLLKDGDVLLIYNAKDCALYSHATDELNPTNGSLDRYRDFGVEVLLPDGKVLVSGCIGGGDNTAELYDPMTKDWTYTTGNMAEGRYGHVGVLLPPPWNQVLIAGGSGGGSVCELYTPGTQSWTTTGPLNIAERYKGAMVLLPSGKALIIGGQDPGVDITCETYDPDSAKWTREDDMEFNRQGHLNAVVLQTGKVLVPGGQDNEDRAEIYDPTDGQGAWAVKPVLKVGRAYHTVTPLPIIPSENCSTTVLIVGGKDNGGVLQECELYNYSFEEVTITDDLAEARSCHTAVLLASGQVLVAGGEGSSGSAISSSEIYTIGKPGSWAPAGAMGDARFDHSATLLKDGRVLVAGGKNAGILNACEIYNGGWNPAPIMGTPRARHTAVMLLNGNVLVIGGQTTGGSATAKCELWDGTSWIGKADMSTARYWHTATLLQSGKVLVAGGTSNGTSGLSSCEIYDPDIDSWSPEGDLNTARYLHNTTLLYSGLVLVTGGNGSANSCEIWDPAAEWDEAANTHKWKITAPLSTGREYHSSVLITDTMPFILAIGGKDGGGGYLNSIEEYDVGLGYRKIWQSTITSHKAVTRVSPSMDIKGTLFRGVSEADGGNYCHIVNSDHPIMSFVRIGGGNWQGNGGGEVMYIPQSSSWDDVHTVVNPPTNIAGYYRLWSIVNGIPCTWHKPCALEIEEPELSTLNSQLLTLKVYPNPATTKASIKFRVQSSELKDKELSILNSQLLTLTIHDISGRLVRSLTITEHRTPNTEVTWDRRDSQGKKVKSGVYFYSIKYKDSGAKGKFVILK